tara:strand:- start:1695 stop:2702 length:1008 start_codon:yes stop_codon:yes gene_type:complete
MRYLITGAAGFIGMHTSNELLKRNNNVVLGIDNLSSYYDKNLKIDRLRYLKKFKKFKFIKSDISNFKSLLNISKKFKPHFIIHLAAQVGVRYSINNPFEYTKSNLVGFGNILECSKILKIKHLVFASSSSVYGSNKEFPFKESDNVDHPISFYAASKKSNEIMAHSYSHLFGLPVTGLRFFTVYGPWGRPDMFFFLLTSSIKNNKPIKIFNNGNMFRDFTYIDDIVKAIIKISLKPPKPTKKKIRKNLKPHISNSPYRIFNIGNNKPVHLKKLINLLEEILGKRAKKIYTRAQMGDVRYTHANINNLYKLIKFRPKVKLRQGIENFINWYNNYYK